jgi:hypothetical protein
VRCRAASCEHVGILFVHFCFCDACYCPHEPLCSCIYALCGGQLCFHILAWYMAAFFSGVALQSPHLTWRHRIISRFVVLHSRRVRFRWALSREYHHQERKEKTLVLLAHVPSVPSHKWEGLPGMDWGFSPSYGTERHDRPYPSGQRSSGRASTPKACFGICSLVRNFGIRALIGGP